MGRLWVGAVLVPIASARPTPLSQPRVWPDGLLGLVRHLVFHAALFANGAKGAMCAMLMVGRCTRDCVQRMPNWSTERGVKTCNNTWPLAFISPNCLQ